MNLLVCLIAASGIALCVVMLINVGRGKKRLALKKQKRVDEVMNQFLYGGMEFSVDFVFDALKAKLLDEDIKKEDGVILSGSTAVFCLFFAGEIGFQRVIDCYVAAKKAGAKRMLLLTLLGCDKAARAGLGRLSDMKIDVFDRNKSHDFLGWAGKFPEVRLVSVQKKAPIRTLFLNALAKDKARNYFVISIVLLLSSYFVAYSIYYIVAASFTFCLAIVSRLNLGKRLSKD